MNCVFDQVGEVDGRSLHRCLACGREIRLPPSMAGKPITAACGAEPTAIPAGVGTHLKRLLGWWGYTATADGSCGCDDHAFEMDIRGLDWCKANRGVILRWLSEEAARREIEWTATLAVGARAAIEAAIVAATIA